MSYLGVENEYTVFLKRDDNSQVVRPDFLSSNSLRDVNGDYFILGSSDRRHAVNRWAYRDFTYWLANGGKVYKDVTSVLEYASPEAKNVKDATLCEKAGEIITGAIVSKFEKEGKLYLLKRSADLHLGDIRGWGSHENYAVPREKFRNIKEIGSAENQLLCLFLASRYVVCGSGHVGFAKNQGKDIPWFLISPRLNHTMHLTNEQTRGLSRPLINTRDDQDFMQGRLSGYKRLHIIMGDMNRSDWSIYLKLGITAIVLSFLNHADKDTLGQLLCLLPPAREILGRARWANLFLNYHGAGNNGFPAMVDIQMRIRDAVAPMLRDIEQDVPECREIFAEWSAALDAVSSTAETMFSKRLDWLIRKSLIEKILGAPIQDFNRIDDGVRVGKILSFDFLYNKVNGDDFYRALVASGFAEEKYGAEESKAYCFSPPAGRARDRVSLARYLNHLGLIPHVGELNWEGIRLTRNVASMDKGKTAKFILFDDRPFNELKSEVDSVNKWIRGG